MDDLGYWLVFNRVMGIGPARLRALLQYFGDLRTAWEADEGAWRAAGLDQRTIRNLAEARRRLHPDREREQLERSGAMAFTWEDPAYPLLLRRIPDPPPVLFVRGHLAEADRWALAIVGTRRPTAYGRQATEWFSGELARAGIPIVSGLARGIDAIAHEAALRAGGRTIAVLPCGVDRVYPLEHARLAARILESGALVSELPLGAPAEPGNFPARNRLISGLAVGVLVVEAGAASGALITASHAAEQGREVFAIPGSVFSPASQGTNRLIRDGATPVTSPQELLEALNWSTAAQQVEAQLQLPADPIEARLLEVLSREPQHIDDIARAAGLPVAQVSSALTMMELKGMARHLGAMHYVRGSC
ncbi:DNA-processing protein DprA [Thermoflexus sp.]|uniref:DNA-processing protein DprA n=1 Tax=Thermoflexus sp. TaxID=1969742 RepID=UPI0025EF04EF|nr:DNA-processing protein DprA [Thermoflexus sp.]MDW8180292.1 DNA-processing protein DprA [Anaerolineae bacterium]MCS6963160.1 DNA-processing protein DprA [Thermoflexus sp.]MCS7350841.1 DNA-processing protein DprA [Thermoflexus sp.]MCX7690231.1 DNA-processing protein DprA [Thermoflexus sp.]MDW8185437.1 DNA-processing protein DprA [Anaerolineae bacterium]